MNLEEITHSIKFLVQQQMNGYRPFIFGHVATYDPKTNRARVIYPSLSTDGINYVLSSWLPINAPGAANGSGIQCLLKGGATLTQPTAGEQCLVGLVDKNRGTGSILAIHYNNNSVPPADQGSYAAGDIIIQTVGGGKIVVKDDGSNVMLTSSATGSTIDLSAQSSATVSVGSTSIVINASGITLNGNTNVVGQLSVNGIVMNVP